MCENYLDLQTLQELSSQMGRERWRVVSDAAQVVANYLACHPRVAAVRYPGLKADPDFPRAANCLVGGFGPRVAYRALDAPAGEWVLWEADERDARAQVIDLEATMTKRDSPFSSCQNGTVPF